MNEKNIINYLSKTLNPMRFEHSINVANLAVELAKIHKIDIVKAQTAGLLHDCAKCMTDKKLVVFIKKKKKTFKHFSEIVRFSPSLLHSFAGEIVAREIFKIKDKDILNAVKNHTLARENMSILEKLIFVSDFCSADRADKKAKIFRKLAKKNLEKTFLEILSTKIRYSLERKQRLCVQTLNAWNWHIAEKNGQRKK
jgi:predicted HD superfamily hydrolase involved in NAD metabolism